MLPLLFIRHQFNYSSTHLDCFLSQQPKRSSYGLWPRIKSNNGSHRSWSICNSSCFNYNRVLKPRDSAKLFKTLSVSYSVLVFFAPAILLTASFLIYIVQGFILNVHRTHPQDDFTLLNLNETGIGQVPTVKLLNVRPHSHMAADDSLNDSNSM